MKLLYTLKFYFFILAPVYIFPSYYSSNEHYLEWHKDKDQKQSDQRAACLAARKDLSLNKRKELDEKLKQLLVLKKEYVRPYPGMPGATVHLQPLANLLSWSDYLNICDFGNDQVLLKRIVMNYLHAGANINILNQHQIGHDADSYYYNSSTERTIKHSIHEYRGSDENDFNHQEKKLWQRLNGNRYNNTNDLCKKLLKAVPVKVLADIIIEYLQPLPFADYLAHQEYVQAQCRLAFEQEDARAAETAASSRKRKKSWCKKLVVKVNYTNIFQPPLQLPPHRYLPMQAAPLACQILATALLQDR